MSATKRESPSFSDNVISIAMTLLVLNVRNSRPRNLTPSSIRSPCSLGTERCPRHTGWGRVDFSVSSSAEGAGHFAGAAAGHVGDLGVAAAYGAGAQVLPRTVDFVDHLTDVVFAPFDITIGHEELFPSRAVGFAQPPSVEFQAFGIGAGDDPVIALGGCAGDLGGSLASGAGGAGGRIVGGAVAGGAEDFPVTEAGLAQRIVVLALPFLDGLITGESAADAFDLVPG